MIRYLTTGPLGARLRAAVGALAAATAFSACTTATEVLEVTDPDIINPSDVASPAGANAVRLGALARLNTATSGGENLHLLGGLFTDEWINGDSFISRQEIDQRIITLENADVTAAMRRLHRARLSAEQAIDLLQEFVIGGPARDIAEMYFVQAYVENIMAEHFCSGLVFSSVVEGQEQYGSQITTTEALERALAHADSGLALLTGSASADDRVRNALKVTRGRILMNLDRPADAAAAVAGVPTGFQYEMLHAATATSNSVWSLNVNARRYSVSVNEGGNGLPFGNVGNDPRVPICLGGDAACRAIAVTRTDRDDGTIPVRVQRLWPTEDSPMSIVSGTEARLLEAEAQLRANQPAAALNTLNTLRAAVPGLAPLADAGSEAARVDQLFDERGYWLFSRGYRTGDFRRLIRQYDRGAETVFPTGAWHKLGNYGTDVTFPIVQSESNNPNVPAGATCLDRNA